MTIPNESEFAAAIEVVAGNPTEEELAAVIAVLAQARAQQESAKQPQRSTWAKNDGILRASLVVGNGQWGSRYKRGL